MYTSFSTTDIVNLGETRQSVEPQGKRGEKAGISTTCVFEGRNGSSDFPG